MINELVIATRGSQLALWQSEHIKELLEKKYTNLKVSLLVMKTKGDKILDTPLAKIGGKGLFTKELEDAMLEGKAHIAVHSLKDVPVEFPEGLCLGCVTKREDPRDAMLSEKYENLEQLPHGSIVGTTSLRRRMQLLKIRPDLVIKNLRGNVNTRLKKLKDGEFDAIILACAGINRLGLQKEVRYIYPVDMDLMIPAMGQAALGIEAIDNDEVKNIINFLNDESTMIQTFAERRFVQILEGGCQVPIGVHAFLNKDKINLKAIVGMPDASKVLVDEVSTDIKNYKDIGEILANKMIKIGARELLKEAEKQALKDIL